MASSTSYLNVSIDDKIEKLCHIMLEDNEITQYLESIQEEIQGDRFFFEKIFSIYSRYNIFHKDFIYYLKTGISIDKNKLLEIKNLVNSLDFGKYLTIDQLRYYKNRIDKRTICVKRE